MVVVENHVHANYGGCKIIAQEEDGKVAGISDVVQPLLVEFLDVVLKAMPDGLPPI